MASTSEMAKLVNAFYPDRGAPVSAESKALLIRLFGSGATRPEIASAICHVIGPFVERQLVQHVGAEASYMSIYFDSLSLNDKKSKTFLVPLAARYFVPTSGIFVPFVDLVQVEPSNGKRATDDDIVRAIMAPLVRDNMWRKIISFCGNSFDVMRKLDVEMERSVGHKLLNKPGPSDESIEMFAEVRRLWKEEMKLNPDKPSVRAVKIAIMMKYNKVEESYEQIVKANKQQ